MRLDLSTLGSVPAALRPAYDPSGLGIGIVHLGIGAFHRAHQAVYTDDALATGSGNARDWGICGVSQRSRDVPDRLQPQDGLYTVLERDTDATRARVVGCVRQVLLAPESPDELRQRIAAADTRIVSLTVTEKAYRHDPASGRLRVDDPAVAADLADPRPGRTVVGQLVGGLRARLGAGAGPLTVLSCDNLPANGPLLRGLVEQFCDRWADPAAGEVRAWVAAHTTFPATVVDRIVPASTDRDLAQARTLLGVADRAAVVAEPFHQWVIQDAFAAERPAWQEAGAILTADVAPYETCKLRLLNASHSTLAYLGALAGLTYIWQAAAQPPLAAVARRLMDDDASPTLTAPDDLDLPSYRDQVLQRFANTAIAHRTQQVAMDGSHKLPQRLLATARERLATGAEPAWVCLAVASWMRYLGGQADDGSAMQVADPLAARLREATRGAARPAALVDRLLAVHEVFGEDLADAAPFRDRVVDWLERLTRHGALATARAATGVYP